MPGLAAGSLYATACAIAEMTDESLAAARARGMVRLSTREVCFLRAMAGLHPRVGRMLDELAAPLSVCRKVAHADGPAKQRAIAAHELAALVARREAAARAQAERERVILSALESL